MEKLKILILCVDSSFYLAEVLGLFAVELECFNSFELESIDFSNHYDACIVGENIDDAYNLLERLNAIKPGLPIIGISSATQEFYSDFYWFGFLTMPLNKIQITDMLSAVYRHRVSNVARNDDGIYGSSFAIESVRKKINAVAKTNSTVLIIGESGTGKELIARTIHNQSLRKNSPFIAVNCGAIPSELLESELFGFEKGAFTGAVNAKKGKVELANGGTLFLDEIGDMPLLMQVKLLRVLQERCYERVGGNKTIKVDVRIIAATHQNIEHMILNGRFREDLFYRLNVFPIYSPPLRERVDDIPLLINKFCADEKYNNNGKISFSSLAMCNLCHYNWPGNIRELINLIERLSILYPGRVIDIDQLPSGYLTRSIDMMENCDCRMLKSKAKIHCKELPTFSVVDKHLLPVEVYTLPKDGINLRELIINLERTIITQTIHQTNGVVAHAAKALGMGRTTLVEKMKRYGMAT